MPIPRKPSAASTSNKTHTPAHIPHTRHDQSVDLSAPSNADARHLLSTQNLLRLQHTIGNRAVARLVKARLAAPVAQRMRAQQPINLASSYKELNQSFVSSDITLIMNNVALKQEEIDEQVWTLLNAKYHAAAIKGQGYWDGFQESIAKSKGQVGANKLERMQNNKAFMLEQMTKRFGYDQRYKKSYKTTLDTEEGNVQTHGFADQDQVRNMPEDEDAFAYSNEVRTDKNSAKDYLHADSNWSNMDDSPERLPNSEIFWQQFKAFQTEKHAGDADKVKQAQKEMPFLRRGSISNAETIAVIYMCLSDNTDPATGETFNAGTPEFTAILGTENGRGGVYFVKDHLDEIGKTITQIHAKIGNSGGVLKFIFGPV